MTSTNYLRHIAFSRKGIALFVVSLLFFPLCTSALTSVNTSNSNVVKNGLIGYWTFDGKNMTNATATDISGNGNNGTLTNMTATSSATAGKIGQALRFNGTTTSVVIGSPSVLDMTGEMSAFAWINASSAAALSGVIGQGIPGCSSGQFSLGIGSTPNKVDVRWAGNTVNTSSASISLNKWTQIGFVRTGSSGNWTSRVYINGVLDSTASAVAADPGTQRPTAIGKIGTCATGVFFDGAIDDARIYNRALSITEVQSLYKAGGGVVNAVSKPTGSGVGINSGLVGYWTFDGKNMTNATATDISGNGNNGTLTNMTATSSVTSGKIGQALYFNGTSSVSVGISNQPTNTFSYGAWFKTSASHEVDVETTAGTTGTTGQKYLFDPKYQNNPNAGSGISVGTNGISVYEHTTGNLYPISVYSGAISTGWNHVMIVSTNKQASIYLNGVLVHTGLTSTYSTVFAPSYLGGGGSMYGNFTGSVDDVRIYNRALATKEIQALYKAGGGVLAAISQPSTNTVGINSGLVGYWTFDGKNMTNATATDASGNGNNGTLTNMTSSSSAVAGKTGQALSFNGSNKYISLPSISNVKSASFWMKPTSATAPLALNSADYFNSVSGGLFYNGVESPSMYINGVQTTESLGSELITNGNAETGDFTGWGCNGQNNCQVTSSGQYAGAYSFLTNFAVGNGNGQFLQSGTYNVTSGQLYKFQFAAKCDTIGNLSLAPMRDYGSPYADHSGISSLPVTGSWQLFTRYVVADATQAVLIVVYAGNLSIGSNCYFDNISIKPVNSFSPSIRNGSWYNVIISTTTNITANAFTVGRGNGQYFNGILDDIRLYNRSLSTTEVYNLYKLGSQ